MLDSPPGPIREADSATFASLGVWVRKQLGIVFSPQQKEQFADRLRSYLNSKSMTADALLQAAERGDPVITRELAEVVSTNYTFFNREVETFEFMQHTILPLMPQGTFRIWSAAASSGDEAYTTAIHCMEHYGNDAAARVKILGTDISQRQIDAAEAGVYPADQLSLVDSTRRARWFVPGPKPRTLQVAKPVRDMCTFRRMNLTQFPWPFEHKFHIIFLRNVLYYLELPVRLRILESAYDAAAPGAWLLTSLTEPMLEMKTRWRRIAPAVYRRLGL